MVSQPPTEALSQEHLRALYEFGRNLNSSLDFDDVLNRFMDSVMALTGAERGFVVIGEEATGEMHTLVARGMDGTTIANEGYSTTIVNEVVRTREPLLTNNAQYDSRYEAGQSIILRGLRAILCAPMLTQDRLLGVVYVDTAMRSSIFTPADLDLLNAVCGLAGTALENARLYQVAVEKGRIERELQLARQIQQGLLPQHMPSAPGYQVAARWRSAREVAGDFYDGFLLTPERFGVVIGDVSDKGAGAALFMAVARTMIRSNAFAGMSPLNALSHANDLILDDAESGMFVTVYHSAFGPNGTGQHVNAGHNPPLLYRAATNTIEMLPRGGRALGWFPDNPLMPVEFALQPGDCIVYYTDGLTEAENSAREFFSEPRLAELIVAHAGQHAETLCDTILAAVDDFVGDEPPFDDLTLVVVRYTGQP